MSGHSKWSQIKRKKGVNDAQRGKLFTKAAREIIMAAKVGGGDPDTNSRLRFAIQKAKEVNMPNDNIKRAIARAVGGAEGSNIEEITYEAYAQGGVAVIIECMTDNKNRTFPEIKTIINKAGANLADKGAVSYMFQKRGVFAFDGNQISEDKIMEVALNHDVEDIKSEDDKTIEVIIEVAGYEKLREDFEKNNLKYLNAEITMRSTVSVPVEDKEVAQKILNLIEKLEDHDDVQNVYSNADIAESVYKAIEQEAG
ncbi:MAG: YebC/PmpR family DNA-binding transcriptional regulator [Candidatus Margulisbacteria bacterium]|nr:YebC/PmpR family DNA-binding transcriptional regulator [Candidatus Margulisiibacteriota bacterium]